MKKWLLMVTLVSSFCPMVAMEVHDYIWAVKGAVPRYEALEPKDFQVVTHFDGWPIVQQKSSDEANNQNNNAARLNLLRRSSRLKTKQQAQKQ